MWPALLLISGSATGLALGLARLKAFVLIPATIIISLLTTIGCFFLGLRWGATILSVMANATMLQTSYLITGLLSEVPLPRPVARPDLRIDLIRAAQLAIGGELRNYFEKPHELPSSLRTSMKQLALRYG
jgi:hypothetical protein